MGALFGGRATHPATLDSMILSVAPYPDEDNDYLGYGVFSNYKISEKDSYIGHNGNALGYRSLMFYQPDRKMTFAVLINYSGVDTYAIAKALYASLPAFLCGVKDNRADVCFQGYSFCVPRLAAPFLLNHGVYLGGRGSGG